MSSESPYGSWKSPLSSKLASDSSIGIKEIHVDPKTPDQIYWLELRPKENGRSIAFSKDASDLSSKPKRWTLDGYNVGDKVHEYGGGSFTVNGGDIYFVNQEDENLYKQEKGEQPVKITTSILHRYADGDFSKDGKFMFSVVEDHMKTSKGEPVNTIAVIDLDTGEEKNVVSGYDFYAYPRVSPDGSKLVWMQWKHPNMPWDDTEIWIADIVSADKDITIMNEKKILGEDNVNYMEPRWTSDGKLMFICDKTGWWNLYIIKDLSTLNTTNVHEVEKEIGTPAWSFRHMSYATHPEKKELVVVIASGKPSILNIESGTVKTIEVKNWTVTHCLYQPSNGKYIYLLAHNPKIPQSILRYDTSSDKLETLHLSMPSVLEEGYMSAPKHIKFPVDDGTEHAYGYYYPPQNKDFHAPAGSLPPLLIKIHGGPTSSASLGMDLGKQYFTSRGIAILDVNYRGSTGYGSAYRKALYGKWGIYDIEDACAGALYMATEGHEGDYVHKEKLIIDGGSAGGYTTLASLTFRKVFAAGVSFYGVSDLESLAKDTHKFESRYMDQLVAPYPEGKATYDARSPIDHLDKFETPCAFFQGGLDKVVPPDQAKKMFDKINEMKIPCAYVLFPDESHGFKKSVNKQKSLDGEFYFFSKILKFKPADEGIEIPIENLPTK